MILVVRIYSVSQDLEERPVNIVSHCSVWQCKNWYGDFFKVWNNLPFREICNVGTLCFSHNLVAVGSGIYKLTNQPVSVAWMQRSKQHEYQYIFFRPMEVTQGPRLLCTQFASQLRNTELGEYTTYIVSSPGMCLKDMFSQLKVTICINNPRKRPG